MRPSVMSEAITRSRQRAFSRSSPSSSGGSVRSTSAKVGSALPSGDSLKRSASQSVKALPGHSPRPLIMLRAPPKTLPPHP